MQAAFTSPGGVRRSRLAHRWRRASDPHALFALALALAAGVLSLGLVPLGYLAHVLRVARGAPCRADGDCVLLFGKHAPGGRIDPDFELRLARATALAQEAPRRLVLLGGGAPGEAAEAEIARDALQARGVDAPMLLDLRSRDTLENLRNARALLAEAGLARPRVVLLSSRYHLARCALLARWLGYDYALCAAEPRLDWRPATLWRIACEAAWVCWIDVGARWARLTGHRGMLAKVS